MKALFVSLLVIILAMFIFLVGASVCGVVPGSQYLQDPFVYPVGDQFALALETGAYMVDGSAPTGCYILTEPSGGEQYGSARWVWPVC